MSRIYAATQLDKQVLSAVQLHGIPVGLLKEPVHGKIFFL
jgi:hypothetical protein